MRQIIRWITPVCVAAMLGGAGCSTSRRTARGESQYPTPPAASSGISTATAAAAARKPSDAATLQGKWEGEEIGNNPGPCYLTVSGKDMEFRAADPNEWYKGTFTLREDTNPRQVILVITGCSADQYVGKTTYAIYRLEGGTLTITGNEPGNPDVPAAFDSPDSRRFAFKTKR
jgi:uncharacterized protein (TIGR03067 family)